MIREVLQSAKQTIIELAFVTRAASTKVVSFAKTAFAIPFQNRGDFSNSRSNTAREFSQLAINRSEEKLREGHYKQASEIAQRGFQINSDSEIKAHLALNIAKANAKLRDTFSTLENVAMGLKQNPKNHWIKESLCIEYFRAMFSLKEFGFVHEHASNRLALHIDNPKKFPPHLWLQRRICISQYQRLIAESKKRLPA